jgi:putative NADPH-quinone reductase
MRVHYLYCHPLPESFHAAIRAEAVAGLEAGGHTVDVLDLYAEGFDPVLSAEGRRHYHDTTRNQDGLEDYVRRLQAADALVLQFPTWCFGLPAMLKGYLDRMIMPGVAFDISDPANVRPLLGNLKRIVGISTYGRQRWVAIWVGDPPRKVVTRYLPRLAPGARTSYHALYHMNVASEAARKGFLAKVRREMASLG